MSVADAASLNSMMKIVVGLDGARRAGWARMYAERDKVDGLSHDLNIMRSERDIMRRSASYLYGFISMYSAASSGSEAQRHLKMMVDGFDAVLDSVVANKGREDAAEFIAKFPPEMVLARLEKRTVKKITRQNLDSRYEKLVERFFRSLAKRYGFPHHKAMKQFLDQFFAKYSIDDEIPLSEELVYKAYEGFMKAHNENILAVRAFFDEKYEREETSAEKQILDQIFKGNNA